ncbi:MAG TPA: TIGR02270 family protein [Polyangia bacterium]|nr:TIGR02270 family protein [Polyangia bacterium]
MPAAARPVPWDIYEEHLDEAAFLWGQWQAALDAATFALGDVIIGPEERLRAHLDGLVLGGTRVAQKLLIPALADDDAGKVAAATWALVQAEDADHLDLVREALATAEKKETRAALGEALVASPRGDLLARLSPSLPDSPPAVQAVIVDVACAHDGSATLPLDALLASRNPELLAAALRAVGRAPHPDHARFVEPALASPYVAVREAAIEAGVILGLRSAWQACNKLVARNASGSRLPLALLALGGDAADLNSVIKRLGVKALQRDAVWALGFSGTVEAAEAALKLIDDEALGKLAGETFSTITGLAIAGTLVKPGQTDNTSPPEVEEDDAPIPVVLDDDGLPVPHGERVRAVWEKAKTQFQPGVRYLYGQPASAAILRQAVEVGPTWRRQVWLLEIAARNGTRLDAGGWARDQKAALARFPADLRLDRGLVALAKA